VTSPQGELISDSGSSRLSGGREAEDWPAGVVLVFCFMAQLLVAPLARWVRLSVSPRKDPRVRNRRAAFLCSRLLQFEHVRNAVSYHALSKLNSFQEPALLHALDRFDGAAKARCQFLSVDKALSRD